nr:hypothetical protein [Tanacetum cinerariifolium]
PGQAGAGCAAGGGGRGHRCRLHRPVQPVRRGVPRPQGRADRALAPAGARPVAGRRRPGPPRRP